MVRCFQAHDEPVELLGVRDFTYLDYIYHTQKISRGTPDFGAGRRGPKV